MEMSATVLKLATGHARPMADGVAGLTRIGGTILRRIITIGSVSIGVSVFLIGSALGGSFGKGMANFGIAVSVLGFASAWIVDKIWHAAALGINLAGVITEKSLEASAWSVRAITSIMTERQAEFVLGSEGAAVLEQVVACQQDLAGGVGDATKSEMLRGLASLACLQRILAPPYTSAALHRRRPPLTSPSAALLGTRAAGGPAGEEAEKREAARLLRLAQTAMLSYGAAMHSLLGEGGIGDLPAGNDAAVIKYLQLSGPQDLLSARWTSAGPHAPGFILLVDHAERSVVLGVRGTSGLMDTLTDLRCAAAPLRLGPPPDWPAGGGEGDGVGMVHMGMWESALRLDAELRGPVGEALARWKGYRLDLVGHSLGAGVAGLLAMRWRCGPFPAIRCLALAPPCTVSGNLASAPWAAECVTAIIRADDAVCRWSLGSTKDACRAALDLNKEPGSFQRLLRIALLGLKDAEGAPPAGREPPEAPQQEDQQWEGWTSLPAPDKGVAAFAGMAEEEAKLQALPAGDLQREARAEGLDARATAGLDSPKLIWAILEARCGRLSGGDARGDAAWCQGLMGRVDGVAVTDKLYPLGRCVWLAQVPAASAKDAPPWVSLDSQPGAFGRLVLSPSMVSDHLVNKYQAAMLAVLRPLAAPPPPARR